MLNARPIETLLPLLEKVRQRQNGQWSARCPAHDDKGPSLSVRETPEGSVLLHCFGGCSVTEIVGAVGLNLSDLFPPREVPPGAPRRLPRLLTDAQGLDLLADESMVAAVAAGNVGQGVLLSKADRDRVIKAAGRINWIRHECRRPYAQS